MCTQMVEGVLILWLFSTPTSFPLSAAALSLSSTDRLPQTFSETVQPVALPAGLLCSIKVL